MEELEEMMIKVEIDEKKRIIRHGNWSHALAKMIDIPVTLDDLVSADAKSMPVFASVVNRLQILCHVHKIDYKHFIQIVASTRLLRIKNLMSFLNIPRYIAQKLFQELSKHLKVTVIDQAGLRKTEGFTMYLSEFVHFDTESSTEAMEKKAQKYRLPPVSGETGSLESMSKEELLEEIASAERRSAKPAQIKILNTHLKDRRDVDEEEKARKFRGTKPGQPVKPLTDRERVALALAEQEAEDEEADRQEGRVRKKRKKEK